MTASIRDQMQADLPAAMRARDGVRVSVLRTTLAALANAEAVDPSERRPAAGLMGDVERRELSEQDVREVVAREHDELRSAAEEMSRLGQSTEAEELGARATVLRSYLGGAV